MNKKDEKLVWIILGIVIVALVLLPYINVGKFSIYSEDYLLHKTYSPGTCHIALSNLNNTNTIQYTIRVTPYVDGDSIYERYDGTPNLPPADYDDYSVWGGNDCGVNQGFSLVYSGDLDWNKLVKYGSVQGQVDYCPEGVIDPPNDGIVNYRCNQVCKQDISVCISSTTLATCSSDGKQITHQDCENGCDNGACKATEKTLSVETDQTTYSLGENVYVLANFSASGVGISGITVTAQLVRSGVVDEHQAITDENGIANFTFIKPTAGETTVKLKIDNYEGNSYSSPNKIIQIVGNSVHYEVATYSPTQYSSKNITFTVRMTDSGGIDIVPAQLENLHAVISLTQGNIISKDISYKGEGLYEIDSVVDGSGKFVGKLSFNFEGLPQSSPIVEIDVRPMGISIDTKGISPGAYLYDNKTYTINIFDSSGAKLDPETISIKVSLPDGTTVKNIPFSEIKKTDFGVYQFSYTFNQVEKHTFDIYADYKNYARGSARASVAVSAKGDDFGPGIGGVGTGLTWVMYIGIILIVGYLVYKFVIKKKK